MSTYASSRLFTRTNLATLVIAAITAAPAPTSYAQPASPPVTESLLQFDLPAVPLNKAVNVFSRHTGFNVIVESGQGVNATSSAVQGQYTPSQALQLMLQGTGYEISAMGGGGYRLRAVSTQSAVPGAGNTLPAVNVSASNLAAGFSGPGASPKVDQVEITRSGASVKDTPQTVNVVTAQVTEAQVAQSIGDVVRNVASARPANYFGTYESVYTRGFWMTTTSNYLRNGFRWIHLTQPPKRNIERYEFLKGPAGLDYGRVEPGAIMNIVTKKPQLNAMREVDISVSERGGYDIGFDLTGPLNEEGTVLYRLIAGTGQQAFVADGVDPRQDDIFGAFTFKLSDATTLDVDFENSTRDQLMYPGLPVPDPRNAKSADAIRVENFYGEPTGTFRGEQEAYTAVLRHRLNDQWKLAAGYANTQTFRDVRQVRITGVNGDVVSRAANPFFQDFHVDTLFGELKGDLMWAGIRHKLTFTLDSSGYERSGSSNNVGAIGPISLSNPQPSGANFVFGPATVSKVRDDGFAIQDYMDLNEHWSLLAGIRHSRYKEENPNVPEQTGDSTDPTVAVIYKPSAYTSLYASFARSFVPNSGTLLAPAVYADPSEGEQLELGVKREFMDGRLRATAAVYELTKSNVPTPSPIDPQFSVLTGEQQSRGVEFELVGDVTDRWSIISSYGYTDAKITQDNNPANIGKTPTQTPEHTASFWNTYRLSGVAAGWTVGGGVFYTGTKYVANNNLVKVPAYAIADVMAAVDVNQWIEGARLQFNIRNLFDKRHYEGGGSGNAGFTNLYPGLPRTASVNLNIAF